MVLRDSVIGSSLGGSFTGVITLGSVHKCFSVFYRSSLDVLLKFPMFGFLKKFDDEGLSKDRFSSTICIVFVDGLKFNRDYDMIFFSSTLTSEHCFFTDFRRISSSNKLVSLFSSYTSFISSSSSSS